MAASFSRSPITPLHRQNNCKFPPLDPMARVHISTPGISSKRRCNISLAYVPNDNDENAKSRELQRSLEDFPSETLSKGSHSLPSKKIPEFLSLFNFFLLWFLVFESSCLVTKEPEERKVSEVESFEWSIFYDISAKN